MPQRAVVSSYDRSWDPRDVEIDCQNAPTTAWTTSSVDMPSGSSDRSVGAFCAVILCAIARMSSDLSWKQ